MASTLACPPKIMTPPAVSGGKALGSGTTRNSLSCSGTDCKHEVMLRKKRLNLDAGYTPSGPPRETHEPSTRNPSTHPAHVPPSYRCHHEAEKFTMVEADVAASDRSELHAYIDTRSDRPECLTLTPSETTAQYVS
jgi:hypothetical protein